MKHRLYCILLMFIFLPLLNAQNEVNTIKRPQTFGKIHIIPAGITIEQPITVNLSLVVDLSLLSHPRINDYEQVTHDERFTAPTLTIEPRYYYNLFKRQAKGKRVDYYSGQFITFQTMIALPSEYFETSQSFGPMWGFQRTLWNKCYWNIGFGLSVYGTQKQYVLYPINKFSFGLIIGG